MLHVRSGVCGLSYAGVTITTCFYYVCIMQIIELFTGYAICPVFLGTLTDPKRMSCGGAGMEGGYAAGRATVAVSSHTFNTPAAASTLRGNPRLQPGLNCGFIFGAQCSRGKPKGLCRRAGGCKAQEDALRRSCWG